MYLMTFFFVNMDCFGLFPCFFVKYNILASWMFNSAHNKSLQYLQLFFDSAQIHVDEKHLYSQKYLEAHNESNKTDEIITFYLLA